MRNVKKIVIAEDHSIVREGIKALISAKHPFKIVGEARDGIEAVQLAGKLKPDLIIMDLSMPKLNGIEAIGEIKSISPESKVLVLTVHNIEEYVRASLEAGADGYLLKKSSYKELLNAIKHVISGEPYLDPGISGKIIAGYLNNKADGEKSSYYGTLTPREREVLKLIAEGHKNSEIAGYLFISLNTVETHRYNIMKKLDLHNVAALTSYAIKHGLVHI